MMSLGQQMVQREKYFIFISNHGSKIFLETKIDVARARRPAGEEMVYKNKQLRVRKDYEAEKGVIRV
jgi:hypothetical protein